MRQITPGCITPENRREDYEAAALFMVGSVKSILDGTALLLGAELARKRFDTLRQSWLGHQAGRTAVEVAEPVQQLGTVTPIRPRELPVEHRDIPLRAA